MRWRILWLTPLICLAAGEAWWWGMAPRSPAYDYPYGWQGHRLKVEMALALGDRALARLIGYSDATRQKDAAIVRRENALYLALYEKAHRMIKAGADPDAVDRWRNQALRSWRERAKSKPPVFPTLTASQEERLMAVLARRYGVWILTTPEVAERVGLDAEAMTRVERARKALIERFMAEERASAHTRLVIEGAPPQAIAAENELRRVSDGYRFSENPEHPPDVRRRIDALSALTGHPAPSMLVAWVASHREKLETRRKAAWRRTSEAAILDSFTPAQRARWNALVR